MSDLKKERRKKVVEKSTQNVEASIMEENAIRKVEENVENGIFDEKIEKNKNVEEKVNKITKKDINIAKEKVEVIEKEKINKTETKIVETDKKELSLKSKIIRSTIVILVVAGLLVLGYYTLVWTGVWEKINTAEKLKDLILSWGFWGRLGFTLISFLQVTFIPIPSTVTIIAGALLYGPLQASLLSLAGILLGSLLAFFLGRFFGRKLVVFMVGKKTCEKWVNFLNGAKYSFFIMMLLPIFPDDVLCLVAGLTNMSWTFFTVTNIICRPIGILTVSYFGSGYLIPYHGWGLAVWAVIIVAIIVVIVLSYKYQKQIENFIFKLFKNKDKKKKAENKESSQIEKENMEEKDVDGEQENKNEFREKLKENKKSKKNIKKS